MAGVASLLFKTRVEEGSCKRVGRRPALQPWSTGGPEPGQGLALGSGPSGDAGTALPQTKARLLSGERSPGIPSRLQPWQGCWLTSYCQRRDLSGPAQVQGKVQPRHRHRWWPTTVTELRGGARPQLVAPQTGVPRALSHTVRIIFYLISWTFQIIPAPDIAIIRSIWHYTLATFFLVGIFVSN